jgi:serine/threonine-protein kinase
MVVAPPPSITAGTIIGGRYRVGSLIAKGGMGSVYGGVDERLGRDVAIKVLLRDLAQEREASTRFEREAMLVARLGHPNVAQVLDFGHVADGSAYLVMERVPGETLAQVLTREGRVAPPRAAEIVRQVLDALAAAHAAGVIHRDIKPGNVMVFRPGAEREVAKLLDFGIARMTETDAYTRLTGTGAVMGTPAYMAPEQARGEAVDVRTEVYAVGVLLYCLLAGRKPFSGDVVAMLEGVLYSDPPALAALAPEASLELVAVVTRAMRKDPANRFQTAAEMASALAALAPAPGGRISRVDRTAMLEGASPPPAAVHASVPPGPVRASFVSAGPPSAGPPSAGPPVGSAPPAMPPATLSVTSPPTAAAPVQASASPSRGLLVAGAALLAVGGLGGALLVGLVVAGLWWWRGAEVSEASAAPMAAPSAPAGSTPPMAWAPSAVPATATNSACERAVTCCEAAARAGFMSMSACPGYARMSQDICVRATQDLGGLLTQLGHDASACGGPPAAVVTSRTALRTERLVAGAARVFELSAGGSLRGTTLAGNFCSGSYPERPQIALEVPAGASLEVSIRSSTDTTLAVRAPSGQVVCDDDSGGYPNPLLRLPARDAAGTYEVYVGVFVGDHATVTLQATAR